MVRAAFLAWLTGAAGYGVWQTLHGSTPRLPWLGLILTASAPLVYVLRTFAGRPGPNIGTHPVEYSVVAGLGLAVTLAMAWRFGPGAGNAHIWAGTTFVLWWAFLKRPSH